MDFFMVFASLFTFFLQKVKTTPMFLYFFEKIGFNFLISALGFDFLYKKRQDHLRTKIKGCLLENTSEEWENAFRKVLEGGDFVAVQGIDVSQTPKALYKDWDEIYDSSERAKVYIRGEEQDKTPKVLRNFENEGKIYNLDFKNYFILRICSEGSFDFKSTAFNKILATACNPLDILTNSLSGNKTYFVGKENLKEISFFSFDEKSQLTSTMSYLIIFIEVFYSSSVNFGYILTIFLLGFEIYKTTLNLVYNFTYRFFVKKTKILISHIKNEKGRKMISKFFLGFGKEWDYCEKDWGSVKYIENMVFSGMKGVFEKSSCGIIDLSVESEKFFHDLDKFLSKIYSYHHTNVFNSKNAFEQCRSDGFEVVSEGYKPKNKYKENDFRKYLVEMGKNFLFEFSKGFNLNGSVVRSFEFNLSVDLGITGEDMLSLTVKIDGKFFYELNKHNETEIKKLMNSKLNDIFKVNKDENFNIIGNSLHKSGSPFFPDVDNFILMKKKNYYLSGDVNDENYFKMLKGCFEDDEFYGLFEDFVGLIMNYVKIYEKTGNFDSIKVFVFKLLCNRNSSMIKSLLSNKISKRLSFDINFLMKFCFIKNSNPIKYVSKLNTSQVMKSFFKDQTPLICKIREKCMEKMNEEKCKDGEGVKGFKNPEKRKEEKVPDSGLEVQEMSKNRIKKMEKMKRLLDKKKEKEKGSEQKREKEMRGIRKTKNIKSFYENSKPVIEEKLFKNDENNGKSYLEVFKSESKNYINASSFREEKKPDFFLSELNKGNLDLQKVKINLSANMVDLPAPSKDFYFSEFCKKTLSKKYNEDFLESVLMLAYYDVFFMGVLNGEVNFPKIEKRREIMISRLRNSFLKNNASFKKIINRKGEELMDTFLSLCEFNEKKRKEVKEKTENFSKCKISVKTEVITQKDKGVRTDYNHYALLLLVDENEIIEESRKIKKDNKVCEIMKEEINKEKYFIKNIKNKMKLKTQSDLKNPNNRQTKKSGIYKKVKKIIKINSAIENYDEKLENFKKGANEVKNKSFLKENMRILLLKRLIIKKLEEKGNRLTLMGSDLTDCISDENIAALYNEVVDDMEIRRGFKSTRMSMIKGYFERFEF